MLDLLMKRYSVTSKEIKILLYQILFLMDTNLSINPFSTKPCLIFHTLKAPSPSGVATTKVRVLGI